MTSKEELKRKVRVKQLEYQMENAELQIMEKGEEIELLKDSIGKYKEEIQQLKGDNNE